MAKKKNESKADGAGKKDKGASKNIKGDLDALFKNKKSKAISKPEKPEKSASKKTQKAATEKPEKKAAAAKAKEAKGPRKFTEDGLKVYSMEELNMGQGGDTADCPFAAIAASEALV
eukprot:CAMPEP_0185602012 /NCGR_PEP_ID=MMETSP0436-20130131/1485_1 /TAXON_ID=626734 ORGANISM="Favella taraikaensis, Strain Fe Narragansett Bay" /NCGR_SAMPLE_ID=MMETSP0436 /ASSEMBLY_ACC=CAM_ASM_000390 /LENGTH=116 /DNA_ID=CAMNT_0028232087 /DNA_START=17 /DNA_END=364 /DNA_ORIENTATION=+